MNIILIVWLAAMAVGFWLCATVAQAHKQSPQTRYRQTIQPRRRQRRPPQPQNRNRIPKNSPAWNELLILVRYDEATATRLVRHVVERNPHQSEKWILEKALWDLQRDRR